MRQLLLFALLWATVWAVGEDPTRFSHHEFDTTSLLTYSHVFSANGLMVERGVIWNEPVYIPMGTKQKEEGNLYQAYRYVMNNLSPKKARFILYPYAFDYHYPVLEEESTDSSSSSIGPTSETAESSYGQMIEHFDEGSLIAVDPDGLENWNFKYIADETNITLTRAKALYDVSIAILLLSGNFEGQYRDLTYESYSFCSPLYDWIGTKWETCWTSEDYLEYLSSTPNHEKTSIVYVTETDLQEGFLFSNGELRFGVLIVPDLYTGSEYAARSLLGDAGVEAISEFVNEGGMVFSTGKGALLLELIGLLPEGTFDFENVLMATDFAGLINGCDNLPEDDFSDSAWRARALCFAPPRRSDYSVEATLLSTPLVLSTDDLEVYAFYVEGEDITYMTKDISTGQVATLEVVSGEHPYLLGRTQGSGMVLSIMGNPVFREESFPWFYNALFLAMSRPLILDYSVSGEWDYIPALEQLTLGVRVDLTNLFDVALVDVDYRVFVASGTELLDPIPCPVVYAEVSPPNSLLNSSFYLDCSPSGGMMESFSHHTLHFSVYIVDVEITQRQFDIVLLYPQVSYTDPSRNQLFSLLDFGAITVDAYMAALLRVDMNPDPCAHYPVFGEGQYIDNVMWCENKEDTVAYDVVNINIVPIVTPILDGNNQAMVAHTLDLDWEYYREHINQIMNYKYPFDSVDPRDFDILDLRLLDHRFDIVCSDWDTPVKLFKDKRNDTFPSLGYSDPEGLCGAQTNADSDKIVLVQKYFADADQFYEHATQRGLAFLDTSEEDGFYTYNVSSTWLSGLPEPWRINSRGNAMRVNLVFGRNDIYFYETRQRLPLPEGTDDDQLWAFSMDRYDDAGVGCVTEWGENDPMIVNQGYFSSERIGASDYPKGLRPHEYSNGLLMNCDRAGRRVSLEDLDNKTGGKIKLVHYIVPLTDNPSIQSGDDVMYFVQDGNEWFYAPSNTEGDSRFGDYPEVRIVWVYHADFPLDPNNTRKGGRLTVELQGVDWEPGFDPVASGAITYQADQVAILKHKYIRGLGGEPSKIVTTFKRGNMPNENYGKDSEMGLNLEWLNATSDFVVRISVEEMYYDLSNPGGEEPFQMYYERPEAEVLVNCSRMLALRLPALRFEYLLKRGEGENSSYIQPYEYLEPFVRQGNYMQELKAHQYIWGSAEVHLNNKAGLVGRSGGFSWPSNIGISSIPFREYLTTGAKQLIPSAAENSHVEWTDIWGRRWAQPIRSVFVDVPPIPPPVRNFMMTTTFELLRPQTGERVLQWQSDESLVVRAQMKLLNNYPKFFEITYCEDNYVRQLGPGKVDRVFDGFEPPNCLSNYASLNQMISDGHNASYGICLSDPSVVLEAQELSVSDRAAIQSAQLCTKQEDWRAACDGLLGLELPVVTKRPEGVETVGSDWMYIAETEAHWPENFIKSNMWDMTHYDYDDTPFDKAYKYHMDNNLPGLDPGNAGSVIKPLNIIAFPLFKGLGYSMSYLKTRTHPFFPGKAGWWSDNLQNRDHTLVSGQSYSNDVAVGAEDLTLDLGWLEWDDLIANKDLSSRLKNFYVCEFNRRRVQVDPANPLESYLGNVFINNVVPIDPSLDRWDPRLTDYDCDFSKPMYSPDNISLVDNIVVTETSRDWLYFASNLRGNAKETINVLYDLVPIYDVHREGVTKVQDGGRFVYWNPCCSLNTYLIVDNPVSTVIATRVDLELEQEVHPTVTTTFDAVVFHVFHLSDPDEIERQWNLPAYINHYGFGDAGVSVYVGGYKGTGCILEPTSSFSSLTYVKIEFFNNAGFDWNLKVSAINFTHVETKPWNANDLLSGQVHAIQAPLAFNFLTLEFVEPELAEYVQIWPSDHNIDTAPLFFDFENINVATIRDGFKGQYYYKLQVSSSIPDKFRGRLHEVRVHINSEYFDRLPGYNDPTDSVWQSQYHNYELACPNIVFGIPYATDSEWAGQIFYTSGYAQNVMTSVSLNPQFVPIGARFVNQTDLDELRRASASPIGRVQALEDFWTRISTAYPEIPVISNRINSSTTAWFDFSTTKGDVFPFVVPPEEGSDEADVWIVLQTVAPSLEPGWTYASYMSSVTYEDNVQKEKEDEVNHPFLVRVAGAWLQIEYIGTILRNNLEPWDDQALLPTDDGAVSIVLTVTNIGNDVAYHVDLYLDVDYDLEVIDVPYEYEILPGGLYEGEEMQTIAIYTDVTLPPGEPFVLPIYFDFDRLKRDELDTDYRVFVSAAHSGFDLTEIRGEKRVSQDLNEVFLVPLVEDAARPWTAGALFAAIGLPILLLVIGGATAALAFLVYWRLKHPPTEEPQPKPSQWSRAAPSPAPSSAPTTAAPVGASGVPFRHKTVNIDYLMAGARRVTIKDGNPTAIDASPPPKEKGKEDGIELEEGTRHQRIERDVGKKQALLKLLRKLCPGLKI